MQCNITTSLVVSLSEAGFGLDELVYRMEDLANKKAFPELLKSIILVVDENIRLKVMLKQPLPAKCGCTCERQTPCSTVPCRAKFAHASALLTCRVSRA